MSFSSNVKQELCRLPINRKLEAAAELYGILLYCNAFTADLVRITTESRDLAERLPRLMKKVFGFSFDQEPEESAGKLLFVMESQEKIHKMFAQFGLSAARDVTLHVNYGMLEEDEERLAFLRGAFLSGGSVTDPAKRYHLELTTSHYKVSRETCALLLDAGFSPKETTRGGNSILYFKQSDMIEDFLTAIGAPVCAMGVMEAKVEKDLRNGINRRVNCETANLTKVVDASIGQVAAIRKLQKQGRLRSCRRSSARRQARLIIRKQRCRNLPPCRTRPFQIRNEPPYAQACRACGRKLRGENCHGLCASARPQ
ncbi:MAG: DNA-binding protein WhiA [Oscillospiraceae bacterium]